MEQTGVRDRVSVIIPTRDRLALLSETLGSLRAQTHVDWEALIVDDGSQDGTEEQVRGWAEADARIRFLGRTVAPPGGNGCRNEGLAAATGEYVIFLDDDDLLSPRCLESRVALMRTHRDLDFGAFSFHPFLERPGDLPEVREVVPGRDDVDRLLRCDVPWQTSGPIWRRAALAVPEPWDAQLVCWQDWDFSLQALLRGARYRCFPEASRFYYRVPSAARRSITSQPPTADHLRSQERAIAAAHRALSERGQLTPRRRGLLAWRMLKVAELWHELGAPEEGRALWHRCHASGLLDRLKHLEGLALLTAWSVRPVRGLVRRWLRLHWPT
jgi:GT2 family glycosyltransferase